MDWARVWEIVKELAPFLIAAGFTLPGLAAYFSQRRADKLQARAHEVDAAGKLVTSASDLVDEYKEQVAEMATRLDKIQREHSLEIAGLRLELADKIRTMERELQAEREEKQALRDKVLRLEGGLAASERDKQKMEAEVKELRKRVTSLELENERLRRDNAAGGRFR